MNIALHNADTKTAFPNLVLAKLAAFHRVRGDAVSLFMPLFTYDKVYSSKVFTFSKSNGYLPSNTITGGTGYGIITELSDEVEHTCPDYDFFKMNYSFGFLTRGCIRHCDWCVVPEKEGAIREHADIEEFLRHNKVVLLDNNVLAHSHGITQIEKMSRLGIRVDFNQGLDARLIDNAIAKRLAALRWLKPIRLACDTKEQMPIVDKAVKLLRNNGATPREYSCYVLVKEIEDALERVNFLKSIKVEPFAQPYRQLSSSAEPERRLKQFARWVNHKAIFKTIPWGQYAPSKESLCPKS